MFSAFMALALAGASPDILDTKDLTQAIDQTVAQSASQSAPPAALAGRHFRVVLPVATDKAQTLRSFQSPVRWRYSRHDRILEISVGLGEITAANYDQFGPQGLASLPPLQTLYFMTAERRRPLMFRTETRDTITTDLGDQRTAVSYGLATSFTPDGKVSDLPKGFLPAMSYRIRLDPRQVEDVTDGMTLQLEGEVIDLAGKPNVLCGAFVGNVKASSVTGDTPMQIKDKQCFVTSRITSAVIRNGKGVLLLRWGASPAS